MAKLQLKRQAVWGPPILLMVVLASVAKDKQLERWIEKTIPQQPGHIAVKRGFGK